MLEDLPESDQPVDLETLRARRSEIFEKIVHIRPTVSYSLADRPYLREVIELDAPETVLKCGRQVGKSVLLASDEAIEGARIPDLGHLYVAPRGEQAATFSRMVFDVMCRSSPYLSWLIPKGLQAVWQIGTRMMTNGSYFYFRSTFNSPDAIRGLTAYRIKFDEFQDIPSDHIGPIEEVAGNAPIELKKIIRAGTPKTFDNPLEKYWGQSSQCEWYIRCPECGFHNFQDEKLLRPARYACRKCDGTVYPQMGVWVPGRPEMLGKRNGWRITQLMNPNKTPEELWEKMHNYPMSQFMNEVMGLSYAEGQLLLSQTDIQRACNPRRKMAGVGLLHPFQLTAGIDWGTGGLGASSSRGSSRVSYTTLTIGGIRSGQFQVVYQKRFTGAEAELSKQPEIINHLLTAFKVRVVFSDWGFGAPLNAILMNQYGWMYRNLFQIQEGAQKEMIRWSKESGRYTIDRNEMFIKVIDDIKHQRVEFFNYDEFKDFEEDYTSIYVELDANKRRMKFDHTKPDDCFHSTSYAYFASLKLAGALSRYDLTSLIP